MQKPMKEELLRRISSHLKYRNNNETCNLLWSGYLAACLEWSLISVADYDEIRDLLSSAGKDELKEIFLGVPGQYE